MKNIEKVTNDDLMSFSNLTLVNCTLDVIHNGVTYPVVLSQREDYANQFDSTLWDWLALGNRNAVFDDARRIFKFKFHKQEPNRIHYHIWGTSDRSAKKIARSDKGYLGMYVSADAKNPWKLQPLEWDGKRLRCFLRDHDGNRATVGEYPKSAGRYVGAAGGYVDHLNTFAEGVSEFFVTPVG